MRCGMYPIASAVVLTVYISFSIDTTYIIFRKVHCEKQKLPPQSELCKKFEKSNQVKKDVSTNINVTKSRLEDV